MKKLVMILLWVMCLSFNAYGEEGQEQTYDCTTWNGFTFKSLYPLKEEPCTITDPEDLYYDSVNMSHTHTDGFCWGEGKASFNNLNCPIQNCNREMQVCVATIPCEDLMYVNGVLDWTSYGAKKTEIHTVNGVDWKFVYMYPSQKSNVYHLLAYRMEYGRAISVDIYSNNRADYINDRPAQNSELEDEIICKQMNTILSTLYRPEDKRCTTLRTMYYFGGDCGEYVVNSLLPLKKVENTSILKHSHIVGEDPYYTDLQCPVIGCKYEMVIDEKIVSNPPLVRPNSVTKEGMATTWTVAWYETSPYAYVMEAVYKKGENYAVRTMTVKNRLGDYPFSESEKEFLMKQSEKILMLK